MQVHHDGRGGTLQFHYFFRLFAGGVSFCNASVQSSRHPMRLILTRTPTVIIVLGSTDDRNSKIEWKSVDFVECLLQDHIERGI
mmetsp:Transcript_32880/g.48703  ORF Transcript_32880/g.48703 Transcript_32880/m.48703 type:complete len:84 (+) Transcript_32880:154-405(+)